MSGDKPGYRDRVFYRLSEGTRLGDKRRAMLVVIQKAAKVAGHDFPLDSAALLDWGLERSMVGVRLVEEKKAEQEVIRRMAGALK